MIKRHTTFYVKDISPVEFCGKTVMYQMNLNGAFELPFEIEPTKGEHDFTTCEGCQKTLAELTKRLTEKFEGNKQKKGFPYCCSYHSNLVKVKEFNRALFANVPGMVANKIIYTNQHIINNHNTENWYKFITDYIEWAVESFGQMPNDCGEPLYLSDYFFYVTDLLKQKNEVPNEKKTRLLEFLNTYQTPNESPKTDFNILLSTYQKWLKEFPFELNSYFGNLKQHFEKQLPILNGKPETNIFSGMAKAKMHTKSSLIEALINLTNNLLTQINGVTLYEKGLITDANKIKLELVINSRKLKLKQGYKNSSPNEEQRYRKILKDWFNDEKKFIDEITPLLKALPPQQAETKTEQETIEMKPVLKPEAVQVVFEIIKDFFSTEQQPDLKQVIETGIIASKKLLFKGNGNRLTDTFKKLIEHDFITGCQKQDLINWIISNFTYTQQNKVKAFIYDTVEKTISRNDSPCKSPLIKIVNSQIQKVEHPRTKKYNKY